jgi:hypothetical protein
VAASMMANAGGFGVKVAAYAGRLRGEVAAAGVLGTWARRPGRPIRTCRNLPTAGSFGFGQINLSSTLPAEC